MAPTPPAATIIESLAVLDEALAHAEAGFALSDDEGRRRLAEIEVRIDRSIVVPADPYSPEYGVVQDEVYRAISGRDSYVAGRDERSNFDVEHAVTSPFPYATRSPATVGDQLIAQGFLIRSMNLPAGASIIEFGPGWGNTTVHLAKMGYSIRVVEIEPNFVELIRRRAAHEHVTIDVVTSDMSTYRTDDSFDAALFFESFHHAHDHLGLLSNLREMVRPGGIAVFAGEPVADFPLPWGFVRSDGLTAWSIRKHGWYEIGFDTSYFLRTLLRYGFTPTRQNCAASPAADVIIGTRFGRTYYPHLATLPADEASTWWASDADSRFTRERSIMSCEADADPKAVSFVVSNYAPTEQPVEIVLGGRTTMTTLPPAAQRVTVTADVGRWAGLVEISTRTWSPARALGTADRRQLGVAIHSFELR